MRHRVDISPQAKGMLKFIAESSGSPVMSVSAVTELCIQAAYEKVRDGLLIDGQTLDRGLIMDKLDGILSLLQEIVPEV